MRLTPAAILCLLWACGGSASTLDAALAPDASSGADATISADATPVGDDAGTADDATPLADDATVDAGPAADAAPPCFTPACDVEREQAASDRMEAVRNTPGLLRSFLRDFPKGGDLHNHLSGAIYAESYLRWARTDGMCVNAMTQALVVRGSCGNTNIVPLPAEDDDSGLGILVRAWSMQDFVSTGVGSGHDHFFATFGKFGLSAGMNNGPMLAEARTRAAADGARYLELMNPFVNSVGTLSDRLWTGAGSPTVADLPALHAAILADASLMTTLRRSITDTDGEEAQARTLLDCDGVAPQPGCAVTVRYLPTASRTRPAAYVFGQLVGAFELGIIDPRIVGLNLVSPEDDSVAFRDYTIQMQMVGWLHDTYAGRSPIRVSLHAGELAGPILPASRQGELRYHMRAALDVAHVDRIGHGVDVEMEDGADQLIADLIASDVLVEIGLSSNAQILEVEGAAHPLARYLADGVPVALATDDQGVSRSSLTGEHIRAVSAQGVSYAALKRMARASLHYAFVEGESLWTDLRAQPPVRAAACAGGSPGQPPEAGCQAFLDANLKARMGWSLEADWYGFEETFRAR